MTREMNIDKNQVRRWVNHFQTEGMKGSKQLKQFKKQYVNIFIFTTINGSKRSETT
ncbi:Hypothetical protein ACI5QL_03509 [Bacillus velezensis]|uniref:Uncharacterized protein n=1 Tax=Bacillus amyloliquefaciens (strain Y2) TaxID=1155777 RepID=I2CAC9_BACAY|nr:hypothetical protein MUS_3740 [Bacillus velezensis YAU B9601-Y2]MBU0445918.1 hypothetical protein [Bacillus amyloliquefaciens]